MVIQRMKADDETASKRMSICKKCPHFWKKRICKKCGCVMPLKVKLKHAKCPIGEW